MQMQFRWILDLNVKVKTTKLLENNKTLWTWSTHSFFQDDKESTTGKRKKINCTTLKLKPSASPNSIKRKKREVLDGEKIFLVHISDKVLYPEYIKTSINQLVKQVIQLKNEQNTLFQFSITE